MTVLNELYASGGTDVIIPTLELACDAWAKPFVLCNGFVDIVITTEDGRVLQATATGMDVALPKRDATGAQNLRFALDNVRGEAVAAMRQALADESEIRLIYRAYVSSDLGGPAENPANFIVRQFVARGSAVEITAGYFDLIDMQYPRDVYTDSFAPGLKYMQ